MTMLSALAFLRTVPRWAWYALAGVALVISVLVYLNRRDARVIEQDRAERTAEVSGKTLQAERTATRNDEARRVERERKDRQLETARQEAIHANPDESNRPSGPAVSAVLDELRAEAARDSSPAR